MSDIDLTPASGLFSAASLAPTDQVIASVNGETRRVPAGALLGWLGSDLISAIIKYASPLRPAGDWDPTSGAFPADADLGTFYTATKTGTVDGVTFTIGDWLLPLVADAATDTYADQWVKVGYSEIVKKADGRAFGTIADAVADDLLVATQSIIIAGRRYSVVPASTYTANGDTVIDLTGSSLQAVLAPGEAVESVGAVLADTRPASWFTHDSDASVFETLDGYKYKPVSSDEHLATLGGTKLRAVGLALAPEQFGAVGDGLVDDTVALRKMLATDWGVYRPDPEKRYHITGQLDFGRQSQVVAPLRLRVTGARNAPGADLDVQTGGGSQHTNLLYLQGRHRLGLIDVEVETDEIAPWLAIIGNDYYLHQDGARPAYDTDVEIDAVKIRASVWTTGYSGDGNGCIRFQAIDRLAIAKVAIENFERVAKLDDMVECRFGSDYLRLINVNSGAQFTNIKYAVVGDSYYQGSVANADYSPGVNCMVVRAVEDFVSGDATIYDAGEHAIRVTSGLADPEAVGLPGQDIFTSARFGHVKIIRPGACGFKAASGNVTGYGLPEIKMVELASLYVEDAGVQDYDTGGTFTGDNHFGLNLQEVHHFSCPSYVTRRVNAQHNGKHFMLLRNVRSFNLPSIQASGCYNAAIFWNAGNDDFNYDFVIGGGNIVDYGRGGTGAMLLGIDPVYAGRVDINLNAQAGPQLFSWSGNTDVSPGPWKVAVTYYSVDDTSTGGIDLTRRKFLVSSATAVSGSSEQDAYSVGDFLFCEAVAGADASIRNNTVDVYLHNGNSRAFVAVNAGATAPATAGAKLSGQWRARGQAVSQDLLLVQKEAF